MKGAPPKASTGVHPVAPALCSSPARARSLSPSRTPGAWGLPSSTTTRRTASSIAATPSVSAVSAVPAVVSGPGPSPKRWATSSVTSRPLRTGASSTGPTPSSIRTLTPARRSGTMMSEKKTAASTPWRRTGCRVASAASSGSRQASSIGTPARSRSARYSGRDRPA